MLTNAELLTIDRRSFPGTALGSPPTRTVIIGDRIASRKIIFLLTSMIHDSFGDIYDEQCNEFKFLTSLTEPTDQDTDEDRKSILSLKLRQPSISSFPATEGTVSNIHTTLENNSSNSLEPCISPLADNSGWKCQIPTQNMVAETRSVCTMSHVFVPCTESSAISSALTMAINQPTYPLTHSNTYDASISSSFANKNQKNELDFFQSLTKKNKFMLDTIRLSLGLNSTKKQRGSSRRKLSTATCHEDIVFHGSEENSKGDDFLSQNISIPASSVQSGQLLMRTAGSLHGYSPLSSSGPSLSSSSNSISYISKPSTRTATTLPQFPLLKQCLESGVFDACKQNRKHSCGYSSSSTSSLTPSAIKSKIGAAASIACSNDDTKQNKDKFASSSLKKQIESCTSNTKSSIPSVAHNVPNDFSRVFASGDSTSAASFFSTFNHSANTSSSENANGSSTNSSSRSESSCFSNESSLTYESVEIPEKSAACIDVSPLALSDMGTFGPMLLEPIVLPPIVGHVNEFHPDFAVQACSSCPDLDEKITQAMLQDSLSFPSEDQSDSVENTTSEAFSSDTSKSKLSNDGFSKAVPSYLQTPNPAMFSSVSLNNHPSTEESGVYEDAKEIVSKTLVIDLYRSEIVEHILVRDTNTHQTMYCNKLFAKDAPATPAVAQSMASVESQISCLISHVLKNSSTLNAVPLSGAKQNGRDGKTDRSKFSNDETQKPNSTKNYLSSSNDQFEEILKQCYDLRFNLLNF